MRAPRLFGLDRLRRDQLPLGLEGLPVHHRRRGSIARPRDANTDVHREDHPERHRGKHRGPGEHTSPRQRPKCPERAEESLEHRGLGG